MGFGELCSCHVNDSWCWFSLLGFTSTKGTPFIFRFRFRLLYSSSTYRAIGRQNALSMLYLSLAVYSVVSFQWFFWGYSLAFVSTSSNGSHPAAPDFFFFAHSKSTTGMSGFIGNMQNFGFMNVLDQPSNGNVKIPMLGEFLSHQSREDRGSFSAR